MEHRTISESIYSCRKQNRDDICTVFSGVYALRYVMDSCTISQDETNLHIPHKCQISYRHIQKHSGLSGRNVIKYKQNYERH